MLMSGVYVLSLEPLVVAVADNSLLGVAKCAEDLGVPIHFLVFPMWYAGDLRGGLSALKKAKKVAYHRVTWLCNSPQERKTLRLLGQEAFFCHHNLFCDEAKFRPYSEQVYYDALYTAALHKYKRIWLAAQIKSLRVITASVQAVDRLKPWGCEHAVVNKEYLKKETVAKEISRSACGLALSKKEGGMFATTEYLLCGRPVVSTLSKGGRDFWFEPRNHLIVDPKPHAVFDAVQSIPARGWCPEEIRLKALAKLNQQRKILFDLLNGMSDRVLSNEPSEINGSWLFKRFVSQNHLANLLLHVVGKEPANQQVQSALEPASLC